MGTAKRNPADGRPAGLLGDERRPDQRTRSAAQNSLSPNRLQAHLAAGNSYDMTLCLGLLAKSYDEPRLRRPSLVLTAKLFVPHLEPVNLPPLTPDEHELWFRLQLLEVTIPTDREPNRVEKQSLIDILRQHQPLVTRLASEVPS